MNIDYNVINNNCYGSNLGSITISSILFDNIIEEDQYDSYTIQWSGDLDGATISSDGRIVTNLANGIYSFKVVSLSSIAENPPIDIEITSPPELKISKIKYSEYSCEETGGYIYIEASGGQPPYSYSVQSITIQSTDTNITINNLEPNTYNVSVEDANGCLVEYPQDIIIQNTSSKTDIIGVVPPNVLDSYAKIELSISGNGPYSLTFINNFTEEFHYIDSFETKYLKNIDTINNIYTYSINDLINPGVYTIIVKSRSGCLERLENINIPNINPMTVQISSTADTSIEFPDFVNCLPIFDTFILPYKFIETNSLLWNLIKHKKLQDEISIFINDIEYTFKIVRNMLDKYCISDNKIEILRLGENSEDWFYYFYLAPSINLNTNPEILNSVLSIKIDNTTYDVRLGLDDGNIDYNNPSIIVGSFIIDGTGYNQFYNGGNICINLNQPESLNDCKYYANGIKKNTLLNMYQTGFVTALNFLDKFNTLNEEITIGSIACDINKTLYSYILNIKNLLRFINNFDNLGLYYVHSTGKETYTGSLSLNIIGNDFLTNDNNETINNTYEIKYHYFDEFSDKLMSIYNGSQLIENVTDISNLKNGFYIVKIKDLYGNIPKQIFNNNIIISYDNHFLEAKKQIQIYNSKILDTFLYGDILVYIGNSQISLINNINIPTINNITNENLPQQSNIQILDIYRTVKQTENDNNTGSIDIKVANQDITNYIYGPNNYKKSFNTNTKFANLIPGVYTIVGDMDQLIANSLYQNETRVIVEKNMEYNIYLNYMSYENKIILKD